MVPDYPHTPLYEEQYHFHRYFMCGIELYKVLLGEDIPTSLSFLGSHPSSSHSQLAPTSKNNEG